MALPRVDYLDVCAPHRVKAPLYGVYRGHRQGEVVTHLVHVPLLSAEVDLHVYVEEGRPCGVELQPGVLPEPWAVLNLHLEELPPWGSVQPARELEGLRLLEPLIGLVHPLEGLLLGPLHEFFIFSYLWHPTLHPRTYLP